MDKIDSLDYLFPPFADQIKKLNAKVNPARFFVYETYRSFARQLELYGQGRECVNGIWKVIDESKIVTKAKPGLSWHAYGVATDYAVDGNPQKQGVQWDWDDYDESQPGKQPIPWEVLGDAAKELQIEWAGSWVSFKEMSHTQNRFGYQISDLYPILTTDGLEAVWKFLIKKIPSTPNVVAIPVSLKALDAQENSKEKILITTESDLNHITNTEDAVKEIEKPQSYSRINISDFLKKVFQFIFKKR